MSYDMAGSYILIDLPITEAKQRFIDLNMTSESDEYFQEGKWTILFDYLGDEFEVDFLLKLAGKNGVIQVYFSEDNVEGSLVVISQGKVIRELYDYSECAEENKSIGLLEFEAKEPLEDWVHISSSIDKLLNINL